MKIPEPKKQTVLRHHYDPAKKHLTVTFHGGRRYRYENVDEATAAGLAKAPSKGSYLHSAVIGKFDATKL
jgi:hypothetical protein